VVQNKNLEFLHVFLAWLVLGAKLSKLDLTTATIARDRKEYKINLTGPDLGHPLGSFLGKQLFPGLGFRL
jgi:hypothetical protein